MNFWEDLKIRLKASTEALNHDENYNTTLNSGQLPEYHAYRANLPEHLNFDHDYDLQGAFKAGIKPDENGHMVDTFKKPNHITFSSHSQYHSPETPGGEWVQHPEANNWSFTPSTHNIAMHGIPKLQNYFKTYEKGNNLILPGATS